MSTRPAPLLLVLLALGALATGCGGSGDDATAVPDGAPNIAGEKLKACLEDTEALDAIGGPNAGGAGDPGFEVIATKGEEGPGALIAVYATADEAGAALPAIAENLSKSTGFPGANADAAEQHGSVNVVWLPDPPASDAREAVEGCLEAA
jgi:hypothetical protein